MRAIQLCLPINEPCLLRTLLDEAIPLVQCKPATRAMHIVNAGLLLRYFGNVDVRTLGFAQLRGYLRDEVKRGLCKESVKKRLSTLKHAMLEAVARRVIERLPEWPQIRSDTRPKEAFWTIDELNAFVVECEDEDLAAWAIVGWWCGFHASDVDRFRWVDVDLERGVWTRRNSKTCVRWVELPIPDGFKVWLRERYLRLGPHPRDLVAARLGYPNAAIRRVCKRAGITVISTIGLRHSCETYLAEKGCNELFQQTWLGLTSPRMLRVYRHPTKIGLAAGAELLNAAG